VCALLNDVKVRIVFSLMSGWRTSIFTRSCLEPPKRTSRRADYCLLIPCNPAKTNTMRCYVSGEKIGVTIDKEDLLNVFEKFGKISDCWVARQPPGRSSSWKSSASILYPLRCYCFESALYLYLNEVLFFR
jgi:hypothetical protein